MIDFLAVVDEGGIRQAALKIHLSQPALTRRIQELEDALGVSLFERTGRGMARTKFGDILLKHARSIELSCSFAEREISELIDGAAGELRIAAGTAWSHAVVPDAIAMLQSALPGVHVSLSTSMGNAMSRLGDGHLDIVIGAAPLLQSEHVRYEELIAIEQVVYSSKTLPLARRQKLIARDLRGCPWILLGETPAIKQPLENYFLAASEAPPNYAVSTTSVQVALRLLRKDGYLVQLPSTLSMAAREQGAVSLDLAEPLDRYGAGLFFREGAQQLRVFTAFRQYLKECLSMLNKAV